MNDIFYDVIVIGAGHSGLEAAFACSRKKLRTALLTLSHAGIANLPCNPSIGGPAKGVVTREIDALGGLEAQAADAALLQIKRLNQSKGPGVWALRGQIDKFKFATFFQQALANEPFLDLLIAEAQDLQLENGMIKGVYTNQGLLRCRKLIITTGTYLQAVIFQNVRLGASGPDGQPASNALSRCLRRLGFKLLRLKTGTPPRIIANSIDYANLEVDYGSRERLAFGHFNPPFLPFEQQLVSWITYTNPTTHAIIREHLNESAAYNQAMQAVGPRYCPSIEDKVVRFHQRSAHQLFIEPIAQTLDYYYLGGLSTSFSQPVQELIVHSIKGLEHAQFAKYAYAIEYDALNPIQLQPTLESKLVRGLYFAGQVNGTSGYEEAAAQGLMAGLNAALAIKEQPPLILRRDQAYIGVLIDDLVTKGVSDPYRLLTSRAEHRLLLRNDNALERLIDYGYRYGNILPAQYAYFQEQQAHLTTNLHRLKTTFAARLNLTPKVVDNTLVADYLKRPDVDPEQVCAQLELVPLDQAFWESLLIQIKYEGYIKQQALQVEQLAKWLDTSLTAITDYALVKNLAAEAVEKLNQVQPLTMGQALRISGINANDLLWIKVYLAKQGSFLVTPK